MALLALGKGEGHAKAEGKDQDAVLLQVLQVGGGPQPLGRLLLPQLQLLPPDQESAATVEAFYAGYRDAGGSPALEEHVWWVVWCESRWQEWTVSTSGYLGLAQFSPATWSSVANISGLWAWDDPYHQGYNTAVLMGMASPSTQWTCW